MGKHYTTHLPATCLPAPADPRCCETEGKPSRLMGNPRTSRPVSWRPSFWR